MPDPTSVLTSPQAQEPIPDLVTKILGASSKASPSYWAGWAAERAFGRDPWLWVVEMYTGDWRAAGEAGGAIHNLATFNQLHADEIVQSLRRVTTATIGDVRIPWCGTAADAAAAYHEQLAWAIAAQSQALDSVKGDFDTMAAGVKLATDGLADAFRMATDYALAAAVAAAATAGSAWTGVGAIGGTATTTALIAKATHSFTQVLSYHDAVWATLRTLWSNILLSLARVDGVAKLPLPSGSYHHPARSEAGM